MLESIMLQIMCFYVKREIFKCRYPQKLFYLGKCTVLGRSTTVSVKYDSSRWQNVKTEDDL